VIDVRTSMNVSFKDLMSDFSAIDRRVSGY
jgi:hypothetical protein